MTKSNQQRSRAASASCDDLVCRFFIQNKCLRGDACPYSHDLTTVFDSIDECVSDIPETDSCKNYQCSICLQSVLVEGRRFGLLPRCNHLFCLDCILAWRNRVSSKSTISRESARRCPLCRIPSYFVIPSNRFYTGDRKKSRVVEYLEFLSCKPCRYYSESAETELCPYGKVCFFHHRSEDHLEQPDELIQQKINLVYTDGSQSVFW